MFEKRKPYRNKKILESARGERCTFLSPSCNGNTETVVFCHVNDPLAGKGMKQKADDYAGFYGCSACHAFYDNYELPTEQMDGYVLGALYRTWRRLIDKGILK